MSARNKRRTMRTRGDRRETVAPAGSAQGAAGRSQPPHPPTRRRTPAIPATRQWAPSSSTPIRRSRPPARRTLPAPSRRSARMPRPPRRVLDNAPSPRMFHVKRPTALREQWAVVVADEPASGALHRATDQSGEYLAEVETGGADRHREQRRLGHARRDVDLEYVGAPVRLDDEVHPGDVP